MNVEGPSGTFVEYREIRVTDPLRQGDVLEAVDLTASKWQRHLLVITADCDFAHDKHQGRVTCVPLLRADEYLMEMQIPRLQTRFAARLVSVLHRLLASHGLPNVSGERLREWPCEVDPKEIVSSLGLEGRDASTAQAALEAIRVVSRPASTLDEAVNTLVEAQLAAPNPKTGENIRKEITDFLRGPYSQPPGDALFLSAVAPRQHDGYFAYLRHLEQIWQSDIAIGPTRNSVRYRRVSRLQDRYTHAMVQRFALVFMSIGLPNEYEEMRDLHSDLLGETHR